jgi:hypothetical protein
VPVCLAAATALIGTSAAAATANGADVVARACQGNRGHEISVLHLAEALLAESGRSPSEFVAAEMAIPDPSRTPYDVYAQAIIRRLNDSEVPGPAFDPELAGGISSLKAMLVKAAQAGDHPLIFSTPSGALPVDLFKPGRPDFTITCKPGKPEATIVSGFEDFDPPPAFSVREKPEELPLLGDDRRSAGSFALGAERERKIKDDGSTKTDSSLKIDGTVGTRLTAASSQDATAYLFGRYNLERKRTRPAPAAGQGSDDTNALELGLLVQAQLTPSEAAKKWFLDLEGGIVFDFTHDARRLKLRALLQPAIDFSLGICGLGHAEIIVKAISLKARCKIQADVEAAQVLNRGTLAMSQYNNFLAAGVRGRYELILPTGKKMGVAGTVEYRILPTLSGSFNRLERLEASLKYRIWADEKVGFDVGFTYADGNNELSFEQEHKITFGIGIIY